MPKVTKIKPQKRRGRYNVYLDGCFALGLDAEDLVKSGIAVGQNLSEDDLIKLIYINEVGKLTDKALRFLSFRPRSEQEVSQYLKGKLAKRKPQAKVYDAVRSRHGTEEDAEVRKVREELGAVVVNKLKERGYIDDLAFAQWWIEQRQGGRIPLGKRKIEFELVTKGVDREVVREVLGRRQAVGDVGSSAEFNLALKAAERKLSFYKKLKPLEFRRKLSGFLARRGFSWEVINKVLEEVA